MARREGGPRLPPRTFVAGYGGPDSTDLQDLTVIPPVAYRLRYGVTARGRLAPDPYVVDSVTITDRDTGAIVIFDDEAPVVAHLPVALSPKDIGRLWRDALYLRGVVKRGGGRPDERNVRLADYATAIRALRDEMHHRERDITAPMVLERLYRIGSQSQLREDVAKPDVGGWRAFRARVYRGE